MELEKEYGSGKGLEFSVSENICKIYCKEKSDSLSIECFNDGVIHIEEIMDWSSLPDPEIGEDNRSVDNPESAIEIAINFVVDKIK